MSITNVPFSRLVAVDAINARPSTKDGLDELAASIAAKGLIQTLAVRPSADSPDRYEVIDGRRRYQAMQKLVAGMKKGELATAAAQAAQACGWLPPELRHPAYALILPEPRDAQRLTGKDAADEQTSEVV